MYLPVSDELLPLNKSIFKLAIPALGALAIDPLLTLVDTAFVTRLGVTELAALGVDTAILGFAFFGFNFLAIVTTPLVAKALGRGEPEAARRWVGDALLLAVVLGIVVTLVLVFAVGLLVDLMGASAVVAGPAASYLLIRAFATPAVLIVTAGHGAFRGYHDLRTPLVIAAIVNGLNLILDPLLIFGLGLGLEGAAIATVAAQWLGAALFLRELNKKSMVSRPRDIASSIPTLLTMGRNGTLVTMRTAALLIAFTVAAGTATRLGAESIAAHQIVVQFWLLASMIADSYAIAGQVLVGEAVGKRDAGRINALTARLMLWGVVTGVALLAVFWLGRAGVEAFALDPTVGALASEATEVAGWMQPVAAPLFVADGIFLGLLALGVLVTSTALGSLVAVGLMFLTPLGDSLSGIWWALTAMMVVRLAVFALSYQRSVTTAVRS